MKATFEVKETKKVDLLGNAKKLKGKPIVKVGFPAGKFGSYPSDGKSAPSVVDVALWNEFGATIEHPGGTSYGYETEKKAIAGKVRFMKKSEGFMQLGTTGAHAITIPERPFMRTMFAQKREQIKKLQIKYARLILEGKITPAQALEAIGIKAMGWMKQSIATGDFKANAPSTLRKKGAGKRPLIDTNLMRTSVNYAVEMKNGNA